MLVKIIYVLLTVQVCSVIVKSLAKSVGSSCEWNGQNGTCVSSERCLSIIADIQEKTYPPTCSFEGKTSIVCCTDCELISNISNVVLHPRGYYFIKTGQKAWDKCIDYGVKYSSEYPCPIQGAFGGIRKIWNSTTMCSYVGGTALAPVGGEDVKRGAFPYMTLLGYGELKSAQWLCGGSLISERFILTAGHCASSTQFGPVTYVALGILRRSDPPELWMRYKLKRFIAHPEYKSPSKYHDIALIEVDDIKLETNVLPACLLTETVKDEVAYATGWGALGHRQDKADTMQKVTLHKFSEAECSKLYRPHRHLVQGFNSSTQACYGDRTKIVDTCEGDSGGPLQVEDYRYPHCVHTIIGVTSYGFACGFAGQAGMYTRVSHYLSWIESIVWPDN